MEKSAPDKPATMPPDGFSSASKDTPNSSSSPPPSSAAPAAVAPTQPPAPSSFQPSQLMPSALPNGNETRTESTGTRKIILNLVRRPSDSAPSSFASAQSKTTSTLPQQRRPLPWGSNAELALSTQQSSDPVQPEPAPATAPFQQTRGKQMAAGNKAGEADGREPPSSSSRSSGLHDEIVVGARLVNGQGTPTPPSAAEQLRQEDEAASPPQTRKRKRTSSFKDMNLRNIDPGTNVPMTPKPPQVNGNDADAMGGGSKNVLIGHWRESPVPDENNKHAVFGYNDSRGGLRCRIQPNNVSGGPVPAEYPVPDGSGGSLIAFPRVAFLKHLVGLTQPQVREYVRLRKGKSEATEEARQAAERDAVIDAVRCVKENSKLKSPVAPSQIAAGQEMPAPVVTPSPGAKRRRVSHGFTAVNGPGPRQSQRLDPVRLSQGTRPTHVPVGYWKHSGEVAIQDRHAVEGILSQSGMLRFRILRETKDGRPIGVNYSTGISVTWIPIEDVELDSHIQHFDRAGIKEYCRVRQYLLDQGESASERAFNDARAAKEAEANGSGSTHENQTLTPATGTTFPTQETTATEPTTGTQQANGNSHPQVPELRQSRRIDAQRAAQAARRQSVPDPETSAYSVTSSPEVRPNRRASLHSKGRTNTAARRAIKRFEATQTQASRTAASRERVTTDAANDTNPATSLATAAAATSISNSVAASPAVTAATTQGGSRLHASENMQRLNQAWARQESLRATPGSDEVRLYNGIKYERKVAGPFIGKLVSQPFLIKIDGEDYVEYRVLTKPTFF